MRSMTYIGMAMSQYVLDNLATMQNLKGENRLDEAEEYAKKVVVSTRTLWKARVEGEKMLSGDYVRIYAGRGKSI